MIDRIIEVMKDIKEKKDWYTIKDACEILQVSQMTIFRWMKNGKLSYFKIGGSVRFKEENLKLAGQKITGDEEAKRTRQSCSACGHSQLIDGKIQGAGRVYFKPQKTRFWVWSDSMVGIEAKMCSACGLIQMFADTEKLSRLVEPDSTEPEGGQN